MAEIAFTVFADPSFRISSLFESLFPFFVQELNLLRRSPNFPFVAHVNDAHALISSFVLFLYLRTSILLFLSLSVSRSEWDDIAPTVRRWWARHYRCLRSGTPSLRRISNTKPPCVALPVPLRVRQIT
jgi:hypothetical protein